MSVILDEGNNELNVQMPPIAPSFDPWSYDFNGDGYIDDSERLKATQDFYAGIITKEQLNMVLALPSPPPLVANLYGVVADAATGYALEGVKVSIGGFVTYTDGSGNYGLTGLTPGSYTITFEKIGYETLVR